MYNSNNYHSGRTHGVWLFFFSDGGNVRCCGRSIVYVFVIISICMWMLRERNMGDKRNADGKFSFVLECWITNKLITNMHDAKKHICCGERSICRSIFFLLARMRLGKRRCACSIYERVTEKTTGWNIRWYLPPNSWEIFNAEIIQSIFR